jgi:hypothetical protein
MALIGFDWMDLFRLIPTFPRQTGLHHCQAPLLRWARPGTWIQTLCGLQMNWYCEDWELRSERGTLRLEDVFGALSKCEALMQQPTPRPRHDAISAADFKVVKADLVRRRFVADFFTKHKQWLDVIEISFQPTKGKAAGILTAHAYSFSSAIIPASTPFAFLMSALLFWIPFGDMGQNKLHLRALKELLQAEGIQVQAITDGQTSRAGIEVHQLGDVATSTASQERRRSMRRSSSPKAKAPSDRAQQEAQAAESARAPLLI